MDWSGIGSTFLAPAVVAAAVSWIFQLVAKGKVDSYFNRQLERFKHDLGQAAAAAQFDYQRKFYDFQKFSERRHDAYVELHTHIVQFHDELLHATEVKKRVGMQTREGWQQDRLRLAELFDKVLAAHRKGELHRSHKVANAFNIYFADTTEIIASDKPPDFNHDELTNKMAVLGIAMRREIAMGNYEDYATEDDLTRLGLSPSSEVE
jgi:hypothetical protein